MDRSVPPPYVSLSVSNPTSLSSPVTLQLVVPEAAEAPLGPLLSPSLPPPQSLHLPSPHHSLISLPLSRSAHNLTIPLTSPGAIGASPPAGGALLDETSWLRLLGSAGAVSSRGPATGCSAAAPHSALLRTTTQLLSSCCSTTTTTISDPFRSHLPPPGGYLE